MFVTKLTKLKSAELNIYEERLNMVNRFKFDEMSIGRILGGVKGVYRHVSATLMGPSN